MSGRTILIVTTATMLCVAGCSHQSPQNVTPIQSSRYLANNSQEIAQDRSALQEDDSVLARKRRELKREQDRLLTYERDQDATRKKLQAEQILPGDSSSEDSDDASLARLDREVTDEHRQIARLEQELKQVQWDVKKDSQYLRTDRRAARRERADSVAHSRA